MNIDIDFAIPQGDLKPLHGVNNGPISFGGLLNNGHRFRELGVPWVRLHDTNWPHPREVDVPQIFPNFEADPDDPDSYCFGPTDDYLRSILDTGAKIIYRLGTSIEHYARRRYVFKPTDYVRWARICLGIVRHYTEGWADGLPGAVDYWEIWNEHDVGLPMWSGTCEDYFELYRVTALLLKQHDSRIKVGGPAACMFDKPSYPGFFEYCRDHQLPLDFYSWHLYAQQPDGFVSRAHDVRRRLDDCGYAGTPIFVTEWNYAPASCRSQDAEIRRHNSFQKLKSEEGAAFCASTLIRMQDAPVEVMNYYDAQAMTWYCGLFDYYGVPQKTFHAFKAFRELLNYPERVAVRCETPGIDVLATRSADGKSGAAMIANFSTHERNVSIRSAGLTGHPIAHRIQLIDQEHSFEPAAESSVGPVILSLRQHSVVLVQWNC